MTDMAITYVVLLSLVLLCQWSPFSYAFPLQGWLVPAIALSSLASAWSQVWFWSEYGYQRSVAKGFSKPRPLICSWSLRAKL